ncbi:MAG: TRAP transporter small permease [Albidovulum sp.]|nr:TRAP transporter small permease [Albidovulum sp.]
MANRIVSILDGFSRILSNLGAVGAGIILLAMIFHILAEIVLRTFFSSTTYVLEEMIGYGIATMSFLGLGYAFREGALIRMNLVLVKLGNAFVRRAVEIACVVAAATFTAIAAWYFFTNSVRDYVRGHVSETLSETPLWLPPSIMLVGMVIFLFQLAIYLVRVAAGQVSFAEEDRDEFRADGVD